MLNGILRWIMLALALILVSKIVPGIGISGFLAAMTAVVIFALVNIFIKPLVMFLTLPINILTFGLFTFIVNAALFGFAAFFSPGFYVGGFFSAFLGSILYSFLSLLINLAFGQLKHR